MTLPEFPTSKYGRRFLWTWLASPAVGFIWWRTAERGGDQWPVAAVFALLLFCIWTVPTAEQIVNVVKAAGALKSNPLDAYGFGPTPQEDAQRHAAGGGE